MSTKIYRDEGDERIPGVVLYAYIRSLVPPGQKAEWNVDYNLSEIEVYRDGMVDCSGLVDFDGFVQKVRQGRIVTNLKAGTPIKLPFIAPGERAVLQADTQEEEEDFVKEVQDRISELNGRPNSVATFRAAANVWRQAGDDQALVTLRQAWEAMSKWGMNQHYVSDCLGNEEWHLMLEAEHEAV